MQKGYIGFAEVEEMIVTYLMVMGSCDAFSE
jgi:hypothetical protein